MQRKKEISFFNLFSAYLMILSSMLIHGCSTTIINASYDGDLARVKQFIVEGVDVNTRYSGVTPLHNAANNGHFDIAKLLIENGADINAVTIKNGVTPLHNAAANGHFDIAKLLIDNGANINAIATFKGLTPLDNALINGHDDVCNLLINKGARSSYGGTDKTAPSLLAKKRGDKKTKGYPEPVHMSSSQYASIDQLYLGKKVSAEQIALIGTSTWLDGNNELTLKSIHNVGTGEEWVIPIGSSGFHDFLEVQEGTYELVMLDPFLKKYVTKKISVTLGETYALYIDQIKSVGKSITQKLLSKADSFRYILLPYIENLKNSRSFTILCGINISDSSVSINIQEFKTFYVNYSRKKDVEWGIGKPTGTNIMDGTMVYEYPSQIYKTELEKKVSGSVSSNSRARSLKLVFGETGVLERIIEN